jgi:hypothetical protein
MGGGAILLSDTIDLRLAGSMFIAILIFTLVRAPRLCWPYAIGHMEFPRRYGKKAQSIWSISWRRTSTTYSEILRLLTLVPALH